PAGGSSRQVIMVVDGDKVRTRLISSRETARLMGLPDSYRLPARYNEAYHLTGDGVAVPVVRHLAAHLFERLIPARTAPYCRTHGSTVAPDYEEALDENYRVRRERLKRLYDFVMRDQEPPSQEEIDEVVRQWERD